MGPDFNDDGRVDGYDMEYLSESRSGGGGGDIGCGCSGCLKMGCLVVALLFMLSSILSLCGTIFYNG